MIDGFVPARVYVWTCPSPDCAYRTPKAEESESGERLLLAHVIAWHDPVTVASLKKTLLHGTAVDRIVPAEPTGPTVLEDCEGDE